jgi:hypothetical protein
LFGGFLVFAEAENCHECRWIPKISERIL